MTNELFAEIVGIAVSLGFSYIPGLKDRYDKLDATTKRLVMAGLFFVAGGVLFGLSCAGVVDYFECTQAGAFGALSLVVHALIANQVTHKLTPQRG